MRRYWRIWTRMAAMSLSAQMSHPLGSVGFLAGKLVRLVFFFVFVAAIFQKTPRLYGYGLVEMALFFLTFNVVDMVAQIFFRGIYSARRAVSEGDFDFYLVSPCAPLFRMALNTVDFLDIATLLPVAVLMALLLPRLSPLSPGRALAYAALTANGIGIAAAIHIFVAALAVRTQELENAIWVYRNLMFMGRFPTDIYGSVMRAALTFVFPIAVMVTFPAKALLGLLSPAWAVYSFILCAVLLFLANKAWRSALAAYTSSSS